jgi:hypothetical protein
MQLEGVVKKINSKPYNGRRKSGLVWSFLLIEDSGAENWVTFGFDKEPPFEEGDRVAIEYTEKNGYKTYTEGTGRIIPTKTVGGGSSQSSGPGVVSTGAASVSAQSTVSGSDERAAKEATRQGQIVWQHSQEMAISKIGLLLQHDGLPMSVAKTKAAQAQRYAEISAAIDKETVKAYNDVLSLRLLQTVADPGVVDTSAPDGIPPADTKKTAEQTNGADDYG